MAAGGSNRTGACLALELVSHASFVWPCSSLEPTWKVISSEKTSLLKVTLSGQWSSLCCYFSNELEHPSLPRTVSPSFPRLQGLAWGWLQGGCSVTVDKYMNGLILSM